MGWCDDFSKPYQNEASLSPLAVTHNSVNQPSLILPNSESSLFFYVTCLIFLSSPLRVGLGWWIFRIHMDVDTTPLGNLTVFVVYCFMHRLCFVIGLDSHFCTIFYYGNKKEETQWDFKWAQGVWSYACETVGCEIIVASDYQNGRITKGTPSMTEAHFL